MLWCHGKDYKQLQKAFHIHIICISLLSGACAELVAVTVPSKKPVYIFTHAISACMYVRSLYQASETAGKG